MPTSPLQLSDAAERAARVARQWAVVSFGLTLLTGGWMRAAIVWPQLAFGMDLPNMVHAHSHTAFFGWLVLAIASLSARAVTFTTVRAGVFVTTAHAVGALSVVALLSFARWGYAAPTIALSAVHVLCWFVLAALLWVADYGAAEVTRWWRSVWILLAAAGAFTMMPGLLAARGIHDGWWRDFGIKSFLAFFVNGFALMGAVGTLLPRLEDASAGRVALRALDRLRLAWIAALPLLAVLYVAIEPPIAWFTVAAHVGVGVMGCVSLSVAFALRAGADNTTQRLALAGVALMGVLQLIASAGQVDPLMHMRPITIAFTHLELLLVVTPLLISALSLRVAQSLRLTLSLVPAAVMCGALVVVGWPWLSARAAQVGAPFPMWFTTIGVAGVVAALAFSALLPSLLVSRASSLTTHRGGAS